MTLSFAEYKVLPSRVESKVTFSLCCCFYSKMTLKICVSVRLSWALSLPDNSEVNQDFFEAPGCPQHPCHIAGCCIWMVLLAISSIYEQNDMCIELSLSTEIPCGHV